MNKASNNIFAESECVSQQDIKRFVDGTLTSDEHHRIEAHLVDCSLCSEALDGFAAVPVASTTLDDINASIDEMTSGGAAGNGTFTARNFMMAAAAVALLVVSFAVFINLIEEEPKALVAENIEQKPTLPVGPEPETEQEKAVEEKEIEEAEIIPEADQITYEEISAPDPATEQVIEDIEQEDPEPASDPEPEEPIVDEPDIETIEPVDPVIETKAEEERPAKFEANTDMTYIMNMHVIDYADFYKSNIKSFEPILGGTSANLENTDSKMDDDELLSDYKEISYEDFLEGALKKFRQRSYKAALRDFRVILDQFPDDVNAYFYGGLCNYNLKRSKKAITYFDKVLANYVNGLDQEAMWYKALSHIQAGDSNMARHIMEVIVLEKGFYADRAEQKLKEGF